MKRNCISTIQTLLFWLFALLCLTLWVIYVISDMIQLRYKETERQRQPRINRKISAYYYGTDHYYEEYIDRNLKNQVVENKHENQTNLDDIFISVKTSGKFHKTRLNVIIDTWFRDANQQTYFFTDTDDDGLSKKTDGHMVNTMCNSSHIRRDLSCKLGAEYDFYIKSNKRWWCHFDDDNYVNVDQLVMLLRDYDHNMDFYIGKPSLNYPFTTTFKGEKVGFWFATGGAGVCISKALAQRMKPWCSNGGLYRTSEHLNAPDDCTLGFVVSNRLAVELTSSNLLHSHLETLGQLNPATLTEQVTLSYGLDNRNNIIQLQESSHNLPISKDPTRFRSLHCKRKPDTCSRVHRTKSG
nr:fringe isoform X1 [Ciona intestinalis]|eukprot:XP_026694842.1 fringe isoform X1 [Ciona intestinalis]